MAGWLNIWLTPLWLIAFGILIGVAILLVLWAVLFAISRPGGKAVPTIITEGALLPVSWIVLAFTLFGILGLSLIHI